MNALRRSSIVGATAGGSSLLTGQTLGAADVGALRVSIEPTIICRGETTHGIAPRDDALSYLVWPTVKLERLSEAAKRPPGRTWGRRRDPGSAVHWRTSPRLLTTRPCFLMHRLPGGCQPFARQAWRLTRVRIPPSPSSDRRAPRAQRARATSRMKARCSRSFQATSPFSWTKCRKSMKEITRQRVVVSAVTVAPRSFRVIIASSPK